MYVCSKSIEANTVTLCGNEGLFTKSLDAADFNFIAYDKMVNSVRVKAKVRYKQTEQWATAEQISDNMVHIEFDEPQMAIAKGQAAVLYDGDINDILSCCKNGYKLGFRTFVLQSGEDNFFTDKYIAKLFRK